ncbi:hypothetical protein NECAME_16662 [Necator americanus]|uniref:Uncharacterized protein n=1 Tax=Necator americanus TaxID=51031 RepID=W2TXM6_NECAM|nr:hypothetical protein NECAME_16662 [Necator americanus]ETN85767.1 hypothetical protein NECAME_16662 [Necator americanus]
MADDPLSDVLYQRMFRVFSYFADATTSGALHPTQASFILDELLREAGRPSTSRGNTFSHDSVTFRELLNLIEVQFADRKELEPAVERVFERIVGQVIRKGFVLFRCRGGGRSCMPRMQRNKWRSGWCNISPGAIYLWPLDKQINNDNRVTAPLDAETRVSDSAVEGDRFVWDVQFGKRVVEFAHFDPLISRAFVTDIRLAIERPTRLALQDFDQKRSLRYDGRRCDREISERQQLETEKRRLEFELEQERLALKDEEIVRGLATRMLEEEKQKSEHMERVLAELQHKLGQRLDTVLEDETPARNETTAGTEVEQGAAMYTESVEVTENGGDGSNFQDDDEDDEEVWKKDDFLMISTQSI